MSLANPVPEIDVSPSATGFSIGGEELLVRAGINSAIHVFQFVLNGQTPSNPNDTPIFINFSDQAATITADAGSAINAAFNAAVATQGVSPYPNRILFVDDSTGISVNPPATAAGAQGELSVLNAPFIGGANIVPYTAGDGLQQVEYETINEINAVYGALGSRLWAYDDTAVGFGVDTPPPQPFPPKFVPPNPLPTGFEYLSGEIDIQFSVNADFSLTPQFFEFGQGPGGKITGMAFDGGNLYSVTDQGGVYQGFGQTYLPESSVYVARQYAFEGLALGPQDIDLNGNGVPGQLAHDLFAISTPSPLNPGAGSVLVAFTDGQSARGPAGAPDNVFDTPINFQGQTTSTGAYQDFTTMPGITNPTGLAFSPLDINL